MRRTRLAIGTSVAMVLWLASAAQGTAQRGVDGTLSDLPPIVHRPEDFSGLWDYNAEHSINIVTRRPEQNPRGAPLPRSVVPTPPAGRGIGPETGERETPFSPSAQSMREARDMARDVLEVPETLTLSVSPSTITFVDDLERTHTYQTDGRRERFRLGASEFNARVRWDEGRLLREIEGTFGFRVSETYFLSQDGNRMFVIVRVGTPARGRRAPGFDRVYDRVSPAESPR